MDARDDANREKRLRELAGIIYEENKNKGLPSDPMRDWREAERIYGNKLLYLLYWEPFSFLRKNFYKLVAAGILFIIFFVIEDFRIGRDLTDIRTRPYLSVDLINPVQIGDADTNGAYYGSYIVLKNSGKTPASNVTVSYYMTTEIDEKEAAGQKWFDQKAEGIGTLGFVAPGGFAKEPGFRSLSPSASLYYFEAIASYQGLNSNRRYWTRIERAFKIDKESKKLLPLFSYAEWDRNRDFRVPALSTDREISEMLTSAGNK